MNRDIIGGRLRIGDVVYLLSTRKKGVVVAVQDTGVVDVLWADGTGKYRPSELVRDGETIEIQRVLGEIGGVK